MNKNKLKVYKFRVGDKVKSSPQSLDVTVLGVVWRAEVTEVRQTDDISAADGCLYCTVGGWDNEDLRTAPGLRYMFSHELVLDQPAAQPDEKTSGFVYTAPEGSAINLKITGRQALRGRLRALEQRAEDLCTLLDLLPEKLTQAQEEALWRLATSPPDRVV